MQETYRNRNKSLSNHLALACPNLGMALETVRHHRGVGSVCVSHTEQGERQQPGHQKKPISLQKNSWDSAASQNKQLKLVQQP